MTEEVKNAPQEDSVDTAGEEQDTQSAGTNDAETDGTTSDGTPIEPEGEKEIEQVAEEAAHEAGAKEEPPVAADIKEETSPGDADPSTDESTQGETTIAASDTPPEENTTTAEEESGQPEGEEQETPLAGTEETEDAVQTNTQDEDQPVESEPVAEQDTKGEEVSDEEATGVESIEPQTKGKVLSFYRRLRKKTFMIGSGIVLLIAGSIGFSVVPGLRSTDTITSTFSGGRPDTAYDMEFFLPLDVGYEKTRFVKVTVALELMDEGLQKEVDENLSQLRKEVIDLILTKSPKEVKSSEGKKELRREITTRLNDYLLKDCIKDTYFTELVIL